MKTIFNFFIIFGLFIFGLLNGNLMYNYYFNNRDISIIEFKPESSGRNVDILVVEGTNNITLELIEGKRVIYINYEDFKYITDRKLGKEIYKKLDMLFLRMEANR